MTLQGRRGVLGLLAIALGWGPLVLGGAGASAEQAEPAPAGQHAFAHTPSRQLWSRVVRLWDGSHPHPGPAAQTLWIDLDLRSGPDGLRLSRTGTQENAGEARRPMPPTVTKVRDHPGFDPGITPGLEHTGQETQQIPHTGQTVEALRSDYKYTQSVDGALQGFTQYRVYRAPVASLGPRPMAQGDWALPIFWLGPEVLRVDAEHVAYLKRYRVKWAIQDTGRRESVEVGGRSYRCWVESVIEQREVGGEPQPNATERLVWRSLEMPGLLVKSEQRDVETRQLLKQIHTTAVGEHHRVPEPPG